MPRRNGSHIINGYPISENPKNRFEAIKSEFIVSELQKLCKIPCPLLKTMNESITAESFSVTSKSLLIAVAPIIIPIEKKAVKKYILEFSRAFLITFPLYTL